MSTPHKISQTPKPISHPDLNALNAAKSTLNMLCVLTGSLNKATPPLFTNAPTNKVQTTQESDSKVNLGSLASLPKPPSYLGSKL